jgi:hypothetical protein
VTHGDLNLQRRILAKITHEGEGADSCWRWRGGGTRRGVGHIAVQGKRREVPRVAYEAFIGDVPIDKQLARRETCPPWCCSPWHRTPITRLEMALRPGRLGAVNAAKSACPLGHPYNDANVMFCRSGSAIVRRCKACRRARRVQRNKGEMKRRAA